jgi:hypothetical protein
MRTVLTQNDLNAALVDAGFEPRVELCNHPELEPRRHEECAARGPA